MTNPSGVTGDVDTAGGGFEAGAGVLPLTATEGFLFIPSCAGTPTGVPVSQGDGSVPIVYDTTAGKLHVYNGTAWVATAALS